MKNFIKARYKLIVSILIIISVVIFINQLIRTLKYADTSTQPNIQCNIDKNNNVWLISYAKGEAYVANQRALTASGLNNCVDSYRHYEPRSIESAYFEKHHSTLTQARGAGYWLWKPYFILKTLEQVPENDFVLYVDTGALIKRPIDSLIEKLGSSDILVIENHHTNRSYTKRDSLKIMGMDNDVVRDSPQLQATFVLVRNTKKSRDFIKTWLEWSENAVVLDDTPSIDEYPDFTDHRHDQSILTLLYIQNPQNIVVLPFKESSKYFYHHRRGGINHKSLIFPHHKLNPWQKTINQLLI